MASQGVPDPWYKNLCENKSTIQNPAILENNKEYLSTEQEQDEVNQYWHTIQKPLSSQIIHETWMQKLQETQRTIKNSAAIKLSPAKLKTVKENKHDMNKQLNIRELFKPDGHN